MTSTQTHTYIGCLALFGYFAEACEVLQISMLCPWGAVIPAASGQVTKERRDPLKKITELLSRLKEQHTNTHQHHTHRMLGLSSLWKLPGVSSYLSDNLLSDRSHFLSSGAFLNLSCISKTFHVLFFMNVPFVHTLSFLFQFPLSTSLIFCLSRLSFSDTYCSVLPEESRIFIMSEGQ